MAKKSKKSEDLDPTNSLSGVPLRKHHVESMGGMTSGATGGNFITISHETHGNFSTVYSPYHPVQVFTGPNAVRDARAHANVLRWAPRPGGASDGSQ